MKKKTLAVCTSLLLSQSSLLSLSGCRSDTIPEPAATSSPEQQSTLPQTGKQLPENGDAYVEASLGDASYLNPILSTDSASGAIVGLVFNGLVKYDKDLKLIGDLAESWEIKDGGREIVFHLRKNVRWHDGKPFTAEDVKFTYERLIDPAVKTPFGSDYELVQSVDVVGPHTLRVRYKEPFTPAVESWGMGMLPKHIFAGTNVNEHPANRRPIGTGPYRFLEWQTDEKIVLTANLDYFEGRPYFNRYIFRVIPDSSVQFLELRQQSIDTMSLTPDQYEAYPEFFRDYNKFRYPAFSYSYLAFNLENPLFTDKRVRQALAHAVNKKEIIDGVMLGFGRPATGPFPPASWAFNKEVADYAYDPARARELLAEAGWRDSNGDGVLDKAGNPFEMTLMTNQGNKLRELCCVIVQNHFSKIGIRVNVRILEWSSFIHNYVDKKKFEAVILGWNLSRDPDQYSIWHSSQRTEGRYNFVGYVNPEVDRLLEEGRRTFAVEKRRPLYHRIHALLAEDLPYIFLYYPEALPVIHKRILGPEVAPAGLGWNFREWFVPKHIQKYHYAA